jgi:hypothetical protein
MSGKSMKKLKRIPTFKTEAEERKFWETHDSSDHVGWSKAERVVFPKLKGTAKMNAGSSRRAYRSH